MRRRWPILAGTVPLIIGWTLTAAYPAAAHAGALGPGGIVQPGGPISGMTSSSAGGTSPNGTPFAGASSTGTVFPLTTTGKPQSGTGTRNTTVSSSNWSGYAATGGPFTSVSSSWVQPAGNCSSGGSSQYAAFWVGLDGYSSSTVEQTGSGVNCVGGSPVYYAWWEMYPGAATDFGNTVMANDRFSGTVNFLGSNQFQFILTDSTQGWTQKITETLSGAAAARSSAEVIAEAPCCTAGGGVLPLANFGTVNFAAATAGTVAGTSASLSTFSPVEITMPDVSVSSLASNGSFSISYNGGGNSRSRYPFWY